MRPKLTKDMDINLFKNFYWLKSELVDCCREWGISATGTKEALESRIETFITTGEVAMPLRRTRRRVVVKEELSLDTVITENHTCSQQVRYFFGSIIPKFHFSTHIQRYLKENVGKTYRDVVEEWYKEEERKKDPNYKREIPSQFEYNTFIRDFFNDTQNRGKTIEDAIALWYETKLQPGSNRYVPKNQGVSS